MKQFALGFAIASLVWIGVLYAESTGAISVFDASAEDEDLEDSVVEEDNVEDTVSRKKKGRRGRRGRAARRRGRNTHRRDRTVKAMPAYDTSAGVSGDALGKSGPKSVSMDKRGGEKQLSSSDIERGIDRVFRGIERCLILVQSNAPATGKVTIGMHIAPSGKVTKVNLKGPNVIIQGESGSCIRRMVKSITYPGFDGPDMIVQYPIEFD